MEQIILHSTPKDELVNIFREILQSELASFKPVQENTSNLLYTRKEVAKMLGISLPTLHEWTKGGSIKAHRIGTRVRYKEKDVKNALKEVKNHKYARS